MRKTLLTTIISVGAVANALAQGTVVFESSFSTGNITLDSSAGAYAAAGSYTVALLWAPGNTLGLPQNAFTQIATYGPAGTSTGYFFAGTVTTPNGTAPGATAVFEVQAWQGNYANFAAALAVGGGEHIAQSAEFLNATGGAGTPPGAPAYLDIQNGGGWDGNLILVVPEPGTLAIAGLGVGAWLYFRRRK